ncbi:MAG: DUF885 family protein [Candidatus Aminicenantes bacterium]|nr:MAG: DUF885 family protein [Candidatus Aminicenantes bacterium]
MLLKDRLWRALRIQIDVGLHVEEWNPDSIKGFVKKEISSLQDEVWKRFMANVDVNYKLKEWGYERAKKLLMDELRFTEEAAEADLDWYIEQPTVPLSYAVGWKMINILRDYEREKLGKKFSLYNFHKKLLNQGSIGLPLVIEKEFGKKALKVVYEEFRSEL